MTGPIGSLKPQTVTGSQDIFSLLFLYIYIHSNCREWFIRFDVFIKDAQLLLFLWTESFSDIACKILLQGTAPWI